MIRSETELLLKHFKGEGRYDVVLTKTDKGVGNLAIDEEGEEAEESEPEPESAV